MICRVWQVFQLGKCDRCGRKFNRENKKNTGSSYYDTRYKDIVMLSFVSRTTAAEI